MNWNLCLASSAFPSVVGGFYLSLPLPLLPPHGLSRGCASRDRACPTCQFRPFGQSWRLILGASGEGQSPPCFPNPGGHGDEGCRVAGEGGRICLGGKGSLSAEAGFSAPQWEGGGRASGLCQAPTPLAPVLCAALLKYLE